MRIKIGISPCPNDTFIFDAIYNRKISCDPFEFDFIFEDVETLNQMASEGKVDVIKLSYAHYFKVLEIYVMLRSGSALGYGVGPLLIAKRPLSHQEIIHAQIAIPGVNTTANFLLHVAYPEVDNLIPYPFHEIEYLVLSEKIDAGVIIHENRFTYESKGLIKLMDLGEYWETKTKLPIPLGGIAIKRNFPLDKQLHINKILHESISYAKEQKTLSEFVKCHAQEMDEDVMRQHIKLYVNENTLDIKREGILAVEKMKEILNPENKLTLFI